MITDPKKWPPIVDAMNGDPDAAKQAALRAGHPGDAGLRNTLESLVALFSRFLATLSAEHLTVLALWVAHTWVIDAAETTPYIHLSSAEPESGKTRLLEVAELVACKPLQVVDPSAATLFRGLDGGEFRTLLIDEVDNYFSGGKSDSEGRGAILAILNSGYRRGAVVPRVLDARSRRIERFNVFGPKMLAGLRELPQALASRSLRFRLQKRRPDERVERFRRRRVKSEVDPLVAQLSEWADEATIARLGAAEPELPEELSDREQDACETLVAIADLAGPEWAERARAALCVVTGAGRSATAEQSRGVELLMDLRDAVSDLGRRLATSDLLTHLNALDEHGWGGWNDGNGLTARNLARLLKPYGISSRDIRINDRAGIKGYLAEDLEDAFARYLPPRSATSATSAAETGSSASAEARHDLAVSRIATSSVSCPQSDVADVADGSAEYRYDGPRGSLLVTTTSAPARPSAFSVYPRDGCRLCGAQARDAHLIGVRLGGIELRACAECARRWQLKVIRRRGRRGPRESGGNAPTALSDTSRPTTPKGASNETGP